MSNTTDTVREGKVREGKERTENLRDVCDIIADFQSQSLKVLDTLIGLEPEKDSEAIANFAAIDSLYDKLMAGVRRANYILQKLQEIENRI